MKVLLIYPPFCTPASPPYSITNLHAFLKENSNAEINVLDLNLIFHKLKFPEYQKYYQNKNQEEYAKTTKQFLKETNKVYSENNKKIVHGEEPELIEELLKEIKKVDLVAFSVVYSSQCFYTYALIKKLKQLKVKTIVGGPAVNDKLRNSSDKIVKNEVELLEYITKTKVDYQKLKCNNTLNYNIYPLNDYFVDTPVIPIKTSSACFYQQCAFCNHHGNVQYLEYPLKKIKATIINSEQKYFFIIDDMISKKRLLEIAKMMRELKVSWMCQLRPTKDLDFETLNTLSQSGLKLIIWGVESGCDRILTLMKKGTNKKDIQDVLENSTKAGIKNVVYVMFGFPSETKEEFLETMQFLKDNQEQISLISTSVFGLQQGTPIYKDPQNYFITAIKTEKRTILEPKITYQVAQGMSNEEATKMRKKYKQTIEKINKFPKEMNFFREHMLLRC